MHDSHGKAVGAIVRAIQEHGTFLIATHINPDGDAIGSLLAMTFMLRRLGKQADPFCRDSVAPGQDFLPGAEGVRQGAPDSSAYDAAILVDCGDLHRVGPDLMEVVGRIPVVINIDHHITSTPFGTIYWVDPSASSTSEMLFHLSRHLLLDLDPDIATQLYTGVLTDTGSFRFANTTGHVLKVAAALVAAGAQPSAIAQAVYESASPQRLQLLAKVLSTVSFHADNRVASAELTGQMFAQTGASSMDSEGFINELRSVKSVRIAILFREEKDGLIHVSLRSKGEADVAALAMRYRGGGHRNAAAFRMEGPLQPLRSKIIHEAMEYL